MGAPADPGIRGSIYNRLVDPFSEGTRARPGYSVEQMVRAIQEDLEKLLNTRRVLSKIAERYPRVRDALGYGMPDLTSLNFLTDKQREGLTQWLEEVIQKYEPRLKEVHVSLREPDKGELLKVKFHMDARLAMDPAPPVAFDTTLELTSGHFSGGTGG